MKDASKSGIGFGLTSGIITTLGMLVGMYASTQSKVAVIGGVLVVAVSDAFSDSLGMHVATESQNRHSGRGIWAATFYTFISKLVIAGSFAFPLYFWEERVAVPVSAGWGFFLLSVFSFFIARERNDPPWRTIAEHDGIAICVVAITYFLGIGIRNVLGVP
ncbi:MAG: hypothetical protein GF333_01320 [Candidatus Omnitrophica bacterium]|nr:hypothetical protein [Candidatus Omnitrophota bacterium]